MSVGEFEDGEISVMEIDRVLLVTWQSHEGFGTMGSEISGGAVMRGRADSQRFRKLRSGWFWGNEWLCSDNGWLLSRDVVEVGRG